jgi:chaperonin cofactor prefoldin
VEVLDMASEDLVKRLRLQSRVLNSAIESDREAGIRPAMGQPLIPSLLEEAAERIEELERDLDFHLDTVTRVQKVLEEKYG